METSYSIESTGDNTLTISGNLTMYTIRKDWWESHAKEFLPKLDQKQTVAIDLSQLERSDSAGLAWLINLVRDAKAHDLSITFSHMPDELVNLAKISDASALLPLK